MLTLSFVIVNTYFLFLDTFFLILVIIVAKTDTLYYNSVRRVCTIMNEIELKDFGFRLKKARETKEMSMEELAKLVGTTKGSIWKYEQGLREPKASVSIAIANSLDVSWDWLIGEKEEMMENDFLKLRELYESLSSSAKEEALKYLKYLKDTRKDENSG